ncbi:unnamed protein product [Penicillium roqueforti FM164]|uniref:Genomic scaffold, ProqFM164S01 n=1 Tax=Penicillium roqueforti (strain FM164) TaxID=1365484 RepID=W6PSV6_PENRF|nr:unnamed protein product [Penicillium roqueforti FM164]
MFSGGFFWRQNYGTYDMVSSPRQHEECSPMAPRPILHGDCTEAGNGTPCSGSGAAGHTLMTIYGVERLFPFLGG